MQQSELEMEVRACIRHHHSRGNNYIKVKHIADIVNEPPQRISPVVLALVEEGTLSIWRETSGNPTVYRISL